MLIEQLPNLSLSLQDLKSSSTICIVDTSTYLSVPDADHLSIQISVPGYPLLVNVTFVPQNANIYKCADLDVSCADESCCPLPDGIYEVIYTVIPPSGPGPNATIDQKFIKIDKIRCKYQHAFLKIDLECGCHDKNYINYMNELRMIKLYIDGSVAECNNSNYKLSTEYYHKADIMLDKLGCRFPASKWKQCNCW